MQRKGTVIRSSSTSNSSALSKWWNKRGGLTDYNVFEILTKKYKFNLLEFGNWSNQKERTNILIDLCIGLEKIFYPLFSKTNNFGLDKHLNFAFGSRGVKGALAHFEPNTMFISIRKYRDKDSKKLSDTSSFAHEYFHALDYFIGRYVEPVENANFLSDTWDWILLTPDKYPIRWQMSILMLNYYELQAKYNPDFLEVKTKKAYWASPSECFARMSEEFVSYYSYYHLHIVHSHKYLAKDLETYRQNPNVYMTGKIMMELFPLWKELVDMFAEVMKGKTIKASKQLKLNV